MLHAQPRASTADAGKIARGRTGCGRRFLHHAGGKAQPDGAIQAAEGEDKPVFCAGHIQREDAGNHHHGAGTLAQAGDEPGRALSAPPTGCPAPPTWRGRYPTNQKTGGIF